MRRNYYNFVKRKNLINRTFDMLDYFNIFDKKNLNKDNPIFIETILKYFCDKYKNCKKKIELRCNLYDLINDLDYLKQYLEKG